MNGYLATVMFLSICTYIRFHKKRFLNRKIKIKINSRMHINLNDDFSFKCTVKIMLTSIAVVPLTH